MWRTCVTRVRTLLVLSNRNLVWTSLSKENFIAYQIQRRAEQQCCGKSWDRSGCRWLLESGTEMLHLLFLLLLHFAFILSHWSPVFSYDSNMTTDDGPLWHLNIQHSEIPSLAPNAKIPGKRHNAPAKIRCPSPSQPTWLGQVGCMGLLVCVKPCSASTIAICERRAWARCLGVGHSPVDFLNSNLAKSVWH